MKKRKRKLYWDENTHRAIVEFQIADRAGDTATRDAVFTATILPSFRKLAENLIRVYKITALHINYDELYNDTLVFLYDTLNKFDPSRGSNSFSYFNVSALHYLIVRSKKRVDHNKRYVSFDNPMKNRDIETIEEHLTTPSVETLIGEKESSQSLVNVLHKIRNCVSAPDEVICIDHIIALFNDAGEIFDDDITRRTTLEQLRQSTNLNPRQLTLALSRIRKVYRQLKTNCKSVQFVAGRGSDKANHEVICPDSLK